MKYDVKSLNDLNDDISRQRTLFVERLESLRDAVLGMGLLATDREHSDATRLLIGAGAQVIGILAHLAVLHSLVRIHKPLTATLARGEQCDTDTLVSALSDDLVSVTSASEQVTGHDNVAGFWSMLQRSLASQITTMKRIDAITKESRRMVIEAGFDYEKLIAGDADEIARAKEAGITVHKYNETLQDATSHVPEQMSLNQLMELIRRGVQPSDVARTVLQPKGEGIKAN